MTSSSSPSSIVDTSSWSSHERSLSNPALCQVLTSDYFTNHSNNRLQAVSSSSEPNSLDDLTYNSEEVSSYGTAEKEADYLALLEHNKLDSEYPDWGCGLGYDGSIVKTTPDNMKRTLTPITCHQQLTSRH